MELVLDLNLLITLCSVGFLAGFIDAVAGGGGMLTIPTLLTAGLPPHIALGTNKLAASFGSFTASYTYYKKQLFTPSFWRHALVSTAIGAIIGTLVVNQLSTEFLDKILPVLIITTAIYTLFAKNIVNNSSVLPVFSQKIKWQQIIQGLTLGFYDGVAGPGTGAFWTASSAVLYKMNILICSGLARSTNFVSNICSLFTFLYLGQVNLMLGLLMGLFIMSGSWVGAHSAIKFGGKFIRPVFIVVVLSLSANLAYQAW
ncbi:MAG: TSUP family transporter [Alteromonadaceae bacterium]|nr:TSUP family transporter [Alteromonadaceae bacterium]